MMRRALQRVVVAGGVMSVSGGLVWCEAPKKKAHMMSKAQIAKFIDHTALKPEVTEHDVEQLCREAFEYGFGAVCVNGCYVKFARKFLDSLGPGGAKVNVAAVVGFPLGAMSTEAKAFEARCAIEDGANEIDMVLPIGALKMGPSGAPRVLRDIAAVATVCEGRAVLKVILETSKLTAEEKELAVFLAGMAGADFVKTSTGFGGGGATVEDVKLMAEAAEKAGGMGVKASGGISTYKEACDMIDAGATRIGASKGIAILSGTTSKKSDSSSSY